MSAVLKDLIAAFQRDLYKPEREHLRRAELEAMTFYNRVRKEAAEKIRDRFCDLYGDPDALRADAGGDERYGLLDAADLIDPESGEE